MDLQIKKRVAYNQQNELNDPSFYQAERIGFWGYVNEIHSDSLTVDVIADNGFRYQYIPVKSDTWVNADNKTGERNLPPVNTRVFVLMPTKTIQNAFVLCSGYNRNQVEEKADFIADAKNAAEIEEKNQSTLKKNISGWEEETNEKNGNITISSKDKNIKLEIITEDNEEKSEKKSLVVTAWNNVIKITDEKGIEILSKKKLNITLQDDVTIDATDKNVNLKCSKFSVNDGDLEVT